MINIEEGLNYKNVTYYKVEGLEIPKEKLGTHNAKAIATHVPVTVAVIFKLFLINPDITLLLLLAHPCQDWHG